MLSDDQKHAVEQPKIRQRSKALSQASPVIKTRQAHFLSMHSRKSVLLNAIKSSPESSSASHRTNANSLSFANTHSLLFEELGSLESQIKTLHLKLDKNLQVLHEKQEKTIKLNETVKRMETRTCNTDVSYEQDLAKCQVCVNPCIVS